MIHQRSTYEIPSWAEFIQPPEKGLDSYKQAINGLAMKVEHFTLENAGRENFTLLERWQFFVMGVHLYACEVIFNPIIYLFNSLTGAVCSILSLQWDEIEVKEIALQSAHYVKNAVILPFYIIGGVFYPQTVCNSLRSRHPSLSEQLESERIEHHRVLERLDQQIAFQDSALHTLRTQVDEGLARENHYKNQVLELDVDNLYRRSQRIAPDGYPLRNLQNPTLWGFSGRVNAAEERLQWKGISEELPEGIGGACPIETGAIGRGWSAAAAGENSVHHLVLFREGEAELEVLVQNNNDLPTSITTLPAITEVELTPFIYHDVIDSELNTNDAWLVPKLHVALLVEDELTSPRLAYRWTPVSNLANERVALLASELSRDSNYAGLRDLADGRRRIPYVAPHEVFVETGLV